MNKTVWAISFLLIVAIGLSTSQAQNAKMTWEEHLLRIAENSRIEGESMFYLRKLTPFLFDFLEAESQGQFSRKLPDVRTLEELKSHIQDAFGQDLIDLGEKMFLFFDQNAPSRLQGQEIRCESEHFVFLAYPQSRAQEDMPMILENAEKVYEAIVGLLGLAEDIEKSLKTVLDDENKIQGKITVRLHPSRGEEVDKAIKKRSTGSANFGATIDKDKNGRLTARIDMLYFNGFSLSVLYHEIAHIALMLGSFDIQKLTATPLQGESDLRKAFFAGYKKIPLFLQEGIGDYGTYFYGFYDQWPLLPPFDQLVRSVISDDRYIPIKKLVTENGLFIMKNHKRFSLEAASFIRFLSSRFEKDKLKQWLLSGDKNPDRSFENIFGIGLESAEREWLKNLEAEPGRPAN